MKTRAIHRVTDCHGFTYIYKQRRWRSHSYKVRRALMKYRKMVAAAEINEDFDRKAVAAWNLLVRYGYDMKGLR